MSKKALSAGFITTVLTIPMPVSAEDLFPIVGGIGNFGVSSAEGVISAPPGGGEFAFVSTVGGETGVGALDGVGGEGEPTNGTIVTTRAFTATEGDRLVFAFNYATSDGAGYADYAWSQLVEDDGSGVGRLIFTARTTPGGNTVPGFSMPGLIADLSPPSTEILAGAPEWSVLGSSSGTCFDVGCGHTGWVLANYPIPTDGRYRLEFGVTNWNDEAYDSAMAIKNLTEDFTPVETPRETLKKPHFRRQ